MTMSGWKPTISLIHPPTLSDSLSYYIKMKQGNGGWSQKKRMYRAEFRYIYMLSFWFVPLENISHTVIPYAQTSVAGVYSLFSPLAILTCSGDSHFTGALSPFCHIKNKSELRCLLLTEYKEQLSHAPVICLAFMHCKAMECRAPYRWSYFKIRSMNDF